MHATDVHAEQWSAWDTGLSNMTSNPWAPAMDGSWTGPAADAGAERAQQLDVYMSKFSDATASMKTITEAQQAADERWAQAPSEAEVRKAEALWLIAKNSDATNAAALEKEYLALKDKRESEKEAYERACEDTKKSTESLEFPIVPDEKSTDKKDPKDPTDKDGDDSDDDGDGGGMRGEGKDDGDGGDPHSPTDSPSSTTPTPSSKPDVTSPTTPTPSSETPHIPVNPSRTELSSDSSASNTAPSGTPKVFPSTQGSAQQPTMMQTQQPQQVMMPSQSAPSSAQAPAQQPAQVQQPYRPTISSPSHSTSTQRDRTDDADPVGLVGSPVPVSHAVPVSHTPQPMPNSSGASPSTSLSSASSAPNATAAAHGANPSPNTPVGGVPGSPVGSGNKASTTSSGRTPTYAADQPSATDKTVSGGSIGGNADDEQRRREMENEEITRRLQEISDRRAAWDKAQGAA